MLSFLIIVAIIIVAMLVWSLIKRQRDKTEKTSTSKLSLDDLSQGGIISITGTDYLVEERNRYSAGDSEWFEVKLTGEGSETWWLGWEPSDEEVTLTAEIEFQELGITPADLEIFADEGRGEFEYQNLTYHLVEVGEARYHRQDEPGGDEMYYWDFHDDSSVNVVSVVQWASGAYDAYAGRIVAKSLVEILRAEAEEDFSPYRNIKGIISDE
ncbi:TPA: DUF4178 domain-containing protein [Candidatus Poribacteria bacterium]|nr:DUF4178 domain-containing protein [Candidatus Poribacteria bacterium]